MDRCTILSFHWISVALTLLLTLYGPTTVRLTLTDPRAKKTLRPVGVELITLRQSGTIQPKRSTTELIAKPALVEKRRQVSI